MVVLSFLSVCSWGAHSLSASLTIQVNRIKGFRPHQRVNYNYNIMCTHPLIHTCTPTHTHPLIHTPHTYVHLPTHTHTHTVVTISWTELDYGAPERNAVMNGNIQTSIQLAAPIVITVTPLTYSQAQDRGFTIPAELPPPCSGSD